ncbi:3240_t:CDS:2 [Ambispora leptoticha]|uniref:3240_t:CDS:1 n=1 Tax=Ambispora leptoticha TaxID=144679 RepID=A0A9N9B5G8_9GLOM|nr:3240_t:CDS:2 [Ambispora leptoticha]
MPKTKKQRQLLDFSQTDNKKAAEIKCGHPKHQEYLDTQKINDGTDNKNPNNLVRVPQRMVMALEINKDMKICTRCLYKTDKDPMYLNHPKFVTRKSKTKKNLLENLKIEMEGFKLDEKKNTHGLTELRSDFYSHFLSKKLLQFTLTTDLSLLLRDDSFGDLQYCFLIAHTFFVTIEVHNFQKNSPRTLNSPSSEADCSSWEMGIDANNVVDNKLE